MAVQYISIRPASGGFGEYERGEPGDTFDTLTDLLGELSERTVELSDTATLPAGVEDIRGRIRNEPDRVFAIPFGDGTVNYFGADIVDDDDQGDEEHVLSGVVGEDAEVIELSFDPTRPEAPVFYRYPDGCNTWTSCPFQAADLRHLTDEQACAKVHAWVG